MSVALGELVLEMLVLVEGLESGFGFLNIKLGIANEVLLHLLIFCSLFDHAPHDPFFECQLFLFEYVHFIDSFDFDKCFNLLFLYSKVSIL